MSTGRRGVPALPARLAGLSHRRGPDGGRFEFPHNSIALLDLYDRLVAATEGAVDLVGQLMVKAAGGANASPHGQRISLAKAAVLPERPLVIKSHSCRQGANSST